MFKDAPNSYKDPYWASLAADTESKLKLPSGLLQSILLNGEKSNANQVSEANAKTPFQVIPSTRDAVLKKYGVDAYLSPENAAEAAGLLLKESLDRNKGDILAAAGEYHGGTNRDNWGPRTKAYISRVAAGVQQTPQSGSAAQNLGSTFQKALAQSGIEKDTSGSIANIYKAYAAGKMTPEEAADFEQDVSSGVLMLPRGATLKNQSAQQTQTLNPGIVDAYNTGKMTRQEMMDLESDIASGFVVAPPSLKLAKTEPLGMIGSIKEAFTGQERKTELSESLPDWASMPELNSFSMASFKSAIGTMASSPEETVKVIKANFPGVEVNQDAKGNYILKSSIDGQPYAIKPGAQVSDIPRALGTLAAFTPTGRATSLAGMAAGAGATQAAIEATQAATGGEFNPSEIATSAALAPVLPAVARGAMAAKAPIQNLATRVMGGGAQAPLTNAQQVVKEAEKSGVRVLTTDVRPPETFVGRSVQRLSEGIPVAGTGNIRAAQQSERVASVKNLLSEFGADDAAKASDNVMKDLASKRAADLSKYADLKKEVINRLDEAGAVPVNRAMAAIDDEISRLQSMKTEAVAPVIARLDDFKQSIQGQGLKNVEELRKQLGESFKSPDLVSVRNVSEKATSKIYGALREDMSDFIKSTGDRRDLTKWSVANKRLSEMAGELNMGALKSTLARGDATPEVVNNMLFSKKASELQALYRGLTPNGRSNARAAILAKAADDSISIAPGGEAVVSPDRFLNNVRKLDPSIKAFFSGDEFKKVEGLARVLAATKRAGEAAASPPTGVQAVPFVAGSFLTDALGGFGAATTSAVTVGLLSRAMESAPVRNLLIQLPKTAKGSARESAMVQKVMAEAQKAIAAASKGRAAAQTLPATNQFLQEPKQ